MDSSTAQARRDVTPPGEKRAPPPAAPAPAEPARTWDVTARGIGNVRAGMSLEEANVILGNALVIPAKLAECDYVRPRTEPKGVMFMVQDGSISRVDVQQGSAITTTAGAKIGDTEARIKSLYPGQVTVQPHKYTDGHYLVVTPKTAADRDHRIVFETDGKAVTRYRSGKLPAVEWVEGCS